MSKILVLIFLIVIFTFTSANVEVSPTIVGGRNATLGQFSYMVSIQAMGLRGSHGCGGGILNERWILTAAHCLLNNNVNLYAVVVGTVKTDEGGAVYGIERLIRHPRYIVNIPPFYTSNWDDIGLLKTSTRIVFNEFTQPIPLGRRRIISSTPAVAAGFGAYSSDISINTPGADIAMSRYLRYMDTRIITHADCSFRTGMFNALNPNYLIKPIIHPMSHICTLQPRGIGACFGDSGSMLIANGEAVGVVVSGVRLCAQSDAAPDIFTRVSSYIDWIEHYIRDLN